MTSHSSNPSAAPSITAQAFQARFGAARFDVQQLSEARRTEALQPNQADLNKDGVVAGDDEINALFRQISDGQDQFQLAKSKRSVLTGVQRLQGTVEADIVNALDNFATVSVNPPPGSPGHDPFEPRSLVASGRFRGEPVNFDLQRSVVALSPTEAKQYGAQAGELAFANYSHNGQHWVAIVPEGAVAKASMLLEHFPAPVPAAHSMLRFHLHEGKEARLVPQVQGESSEPVFQKDLLLSVEAAGPRNFQYDLMEGAKSNFAIAYRFESLEDRAKHTQQNGNRVEQLPLKLTDDQLQSVLKEAVRSSDAMQRTEMYNTLTKNCTTETFHILDRGIGNQVHPRVHLARLVTAENLPPLSHFYLSIRGVMDTSHTMADLAEERDTNLQSEE